MGHNILKKDHHRDVGEIYEIEPQHENKLVSLIEANSINWIGDKEALTETICVLIQRKERCLVEDPQLVQLSRKPNLTM